MCKMVNGLMVLMNNINKELIHGKRLLGSKSRKNQQNTLNMLLYTDAVFGCFKRKKINFLFLKPRTTGPLG